MRLIDADALPRHGQRGGLVHWKDIAEAPTVVEFKDPITRVMVRGVEFIPVVRCRDCKHYESDGGAMMMIIVHTEYARRVSR